MSSIYKNIYEIKIKFSEINLNIMVKIYLACGFQIKVKTFMINMFDKYG